MKSPDHLECKIIKHNDNEVEDDELNETSFDKNPNADCVFANLRKLRIGDIGRVIIATLNINSIRAKFDQLKFIIKDNIDILILTETKIDNSFPDSQFIIEGFSKPYRLDRNAHGGGILIYVREDIPSKQLNKHMFAEDIEGIFVEINLRKCKWLLFGTYHPPNQNDTYYFDSIRKIYFSWGFQCTGL